MVKTKTRSKKSSSVETLSAGFFTSESVEECIFLHLNGEIVASVGRAMFSKAAPALLYRQLRRTEKVTNCCDTLYSYNCIGSGQKKGSSLPMLAVLLSC